jgi:hypothetical protein
MNIFSHAAPGAPVVLATAILAGHALAGTTPGLTLQAAPEPPVAEVWLAAGDSALDQMRGGFDLGAGLMVSFGISRAVYINDQLVTSTSFHLGELRNMTSAQALIWGQQLTASRALIVQNGAANTIAPNALGQTAWSTTIQNSLNNQRLRNETVIQASTNAMGLLKSLNLQASIHEAITNALARR